MAIDCVSTTPSSRPSAGTKPCGLSCRKSACRCSPRRSCLVTVVYLEALQIERDAHAVGGRAQRIAVENHGYPRRAVPGATERSPVKAPASSLRRRQQQARVHAHRDEQRTHRQVVARELTVAGQRAGRFARALDGGDALGNRSSHHRVRRPADQSHGRRQIGRTEEHAVHAVHRGYRLEIAQPHDRFHLDQHAHLGVGALKVTVDLVPKRDARVVALATPRIPRVG